MCELTQSGTHSLKAQVLDPKGVSSPRSPHMAINNALKEYAIHEREK